MMPGFTDSGLIDVRLQRDAFGRRHSRRTPGDGITSVYSGCNFFREFLTIRGILGVRGFGGVGQKTALHEHRRNSCLTQDVVTTPAYSAIVRWRASGDIIMNGRGERQAVAIVKIGFDAARTAASCRIKMNTDEDRVPI